MSNEILVLSHDEVAELLSMPEAIDLMRRAFQSLSEGKSVAPVRTQLPINKKSVSLFMPVVDTDLGYFSLKTVSVFPGNVDLNIPLINGSLMLFNAKTGVPCAVMDAEFLTALRTGAGSGLATSLLAPVDSSVCGVFGSGRQAETQLEAVAAVRPIRTALVFARNKERMRSFSEKMSRLLNIEVRPAVGLNELNLCDVVCTATTSPVSVFEDQQLKRPVHINAIGTFQPHTTEIPLSTVVKSWLVVDQREACMTEAGEIAMLLKTAQIRPDHVQAELGELVSGSVVLPKQLPDCTLFKSVGNAVQDLYTAAAVYERAIREKVGMMVKI